MTHILNNFQHSNPFIVEGYVMATDDPMQMGRTKVMCPAVDSDDWSLDTLPWAEYASPLSGTVSNYPAGRNGEVTTGFTSYGIWAIPKIGSQVLVFFLNGDASRRFYFASYFGLHRNRGLPAGRNVNPESNNAVGPWSDTYDVLAPARANLMEAFSGNLSSVQAQTRGAYERQVAQPKQQKDGTEGYAKSPIDPKVLDPQTYCFVTPGHHGLIMQDDAKNCRVRLKTTAGNQVILDDANERIYISTARGGTWVELDEDGHIHIYGSDSVSIKSGGDFNVAAEGSINLEAGKSINIKARGGDIRAATSGSLHLAASGSIFESCCGALNLSGDGGIVASGSTIHFNGPQAACAQQPSSPSIIPGHEPFVRPTATKVKRGPNWRP